jgi:Rieske 2Fe-2S family protein
MRLYDMRLTRSAYTGRYRVKANWKLIVENFRECYHCGVGHPEYCSVIIGANLDAGRERSRQLRRVKYQEWQAKGISTEAVLFEPGRYYYCERYPYQPGFVTMTLDGEPASLPLGAIQDRDIGVWSIVQYPNFWLDINNDYAWAMRLNPVSETETEVVAEWFVREDAVEGKDYDLEHLITFWKTTAEQDWVLCANNQAGINSRYYRPGPYSDYAEGGPGQFVDWYLAQVGGNEASVGSLKPGPG